MVNIKNIRYSSLILLLFSRLSPAFSQVSANKKITNLNASADAVYLNLETGAILNAADTTKSSWDIAFQHTAVTLAGKASAQVIADTGFDKINVAPTGGYLQGKAAVPSGSGNGWYNYNMDNHIVSPIPGRVILIHTASGKYVKLAVDSYYREGTDSEPGYYTLHYTFIEPQNGK